MRTYLVQLGVIVCLLSSGFAQGARFDAPATTTFNEAGNNKVLKVVPSASIRVCLASVTQVSSCSLVGTTLYSNQALTSTKANPTSADAQGNFGFWVAPGTYQYWITGTGVGTTGPYFFSASSGGGGGGGTPDCSAVAGADYGAKLTACIAQLPTAGGTADAKGLTGAQTISATVTIDRPVILDLGATNITCATSPCFKVQAPLLVFGLGQAATTITSSAGGIVFFEQNSTARNQSVFQDFKCIGQGTIGADYSQCIVYPDYQSSVVPSGSSGAVRAANVVTLSFYERTYITVGQSVTVTAMDDASFNGTFTVTAIPARNQIRYSQTAGNATSGSGVVRTVPAIDNSLSRDVIERVHFSGFSDYAVWLGQSTYPVTIRDSACENNNGCVDDEYASDLRVEGHTFAFFSSVITPTNPQFRLKSGSKTIMHGCDIERNNANVSTAIPDILIDPQVQASMGWITIEDCKFGPEGETDGRPKIQIKSTGTYANANAPAYNVVIGPSNDFTSDGDSSGYAIDIENPLIKPRIFGNYFAGYHTVVKDNQSRFANEQNGAGYFGCDNAIQAVITDQSATDNSVKIFENGGRGFNRIPCDLGNTADTGYPFTLTPLTFEAPELRNRIASSNDLSDASWLVASDNQAITSIARAANVVTVQTTSAIKATATFPVIITGVTDVTFNGTFTIATVTDSTHFTYAQVAGNASSSGGNATANLVKITTGQTDPWGGTTASLITRAGQNASEPISVLLNTTNQKDRMYGSIYLEGNTCSEAQVAIQDNVTGLFNGYFPILTLPTTEYKPYGMPYRGMDSSHQQRFYIYIGNSVATESCSVYVAGAQVSDYPQPLVITTGAAVAKTTTGQQFQRKVEFNNQIVSNLAPGTAPAVVASTTKVTNLNADLLDDLNTAAAATASTVATRDSNADLTARRFISGLATGTSPLSVASITKNANLNADLLDDLDSAAAATVSTIVARDSGADITTRRYKTAGTALANTDFAASAGWGNTASVGTPSGNDQAFYVTVTSNGAGLGASPTLALTFKNGTWTNTPVCLMLQTGGSGAIADVTVSARSATAYTWIWNATPAGGGATYEFTAECWGK